MTYQTVPIDIIGGFYKHRSLPLSAQTTKMLIPELVPSGKTPSALNVFPGYAAWYTGTGVDRGMHEMAGILYKVSGQTLYKVASDTTHTSLGTIAGTSQCIFSNDGTRLTISTGDNRYLYDVVTNTLSLYSDVDHEVGESSVFINNSTIMDGTGARFFVSDVGNPSSINGLNFGTAESDPDDLKRVYKKDQNFYLFGDKSLEPWFYSGVGNPPVTRINQSVRQIGLAATHAVADTNKYIYFLGSDKRVYRYLSFREEPITPPAVAKEFESYATVSDAKMYGISIEGYEMVFLIFPTEGKTWAFVEPDAWVELTDTNLETRHPVNSYIYVYGKHLIADYSNGNIYELDFDTFDNNSNTIIRERTGKPVDSIMLNRPGRKLVMRRMRIQCEVGVGLATGQGSVPKLMVSGSFDGGKSFTNEDTVELGRSSEGRIEAVWDHKEEFYNFIPRIRLSDPVRLSIHSASVDVKLGGKR